MRFKLFSACVLSVMSFCAWATESEQAIRDRLEALDLPFIIMSVSASPVEGLFQVVVEGGKVLYVSSDGKHVIQGALFDVSGDRIRNLTAEVEAEQVRDVINDLPRNELVIFPAQNTKTHITVFTDIDCGYCRKLHEEVEELNKLGVEVRYAAFPRGGPDTQTAEDMQSIWCARDQRRAMTRAKRGQKVMRARCDNPIAKQFDLGRQVGVQGTPAVFLANGTLIPGYRPAQELAEDALKAQESLTPEVTAQAKATQESQEAGQPTAQ
jgi:thiol:disulfide interchange protein DsbC